MPYALCPITLRIPAFLTGEICGEARPVLGGARAYLVVAGGVRIGGCLEQKKTRSLERLQEVARTS